MERLKTITIPKTQYVKMKRDAQIDREFVAQLVESLRDIKAGRVRRVR